MKDLLCWDMDDIKNLKLNARKEDGESPISPETRKLLEKKMAPDYKVYNYFKAKFDQKLKDLGQSRLAQELKELGRVNTEVTRRCEFAKEDNKNLDRDLVWWASNIQGYKINNQSGEDECRRMVTSELSYIKIIRDLQAKKYPKL